jgi:hypothetical protein
MNDFFTIGFFKKYQKNLHYRLDDNRCAKVYSYNTLVAIQIDDELVEQGYWSTTTRKHVNYAASELGLTVKHFGL